MKKRVKVNSAAQPLFKSNEICPPFSRKLVELGFELVDETHDADFFISINHDRRQFQKFLQTGGNKSRAALIRLEPAAVFPAQYRNSIKEKYSFTITPGRLFPEGSQLVPWPYYYNRNPLSPEPSTINLENLISREISHGAFDFDDWQSRPILVSLIASNKVSPVKENNYKIRRRLAHQMSDDILEVYGSLWKSDLKTKIRHRAGVVRHAISNEVFPSAIEIFGNAFRIYSTAKGAISDKHEIIRASKFSLVIENDDNYVSEKLIDALIGGSLPIYVGGKFETLGIPSALAVTELSSADEIENFVRDFDEAHIRSFLTECSSWLQSAGFLKQWAGDRVFAKIAEDIAAQFRNVVD